MEPPFKGLRGNVCTPSIAHWKARGWLPICHNWIFCYLLWLRHYKQNPSNLAFFKAGGSLLANIRGGRGQFPATPLEWKNYRYPCFVLCWDIDRRLFRFVTIHASDKQQTTESDIELYRLAALYCSPVSQASTTTLMLSEWHRQSCWNLATSQCSDYKHKEQKTT